MEMSLIEFWIQRSVMGGDLETRYRSVLIECVIVVDTINAKQSPFIADK